LEGYVVSYNISVYTKFCWTQWSKIQESELNILDEPNKAMAEWKCNISLAYIFLSFIQI